MAVKWSGLGPAPGYTFTGVIFNTFSHTQAHEHTGAGAQQNICHMIENLPMNPCWKPQKKLFEVRRAASGERDYTPKQPAGQSCFTGQCANWIICQHLRVMGLSDGSDPLARMFVLRCLTPCDESKRLWRWCSGTGYSDMGASEAVGNCGAEEEQEAVCPFDGVRRAEEPRENKFTWQSSSCAVCDWKQQLHANLRVQH